MNVMIITIPPPTDYDQTKRIRRCPWCFDEAAPSELGVATPQAMKLAIAPSQVAMEGGLLDKDGSKMAGFGASHQGFSST